MIKNIDSSGDPKKHSFSDWGSIGKVVFLSSSINFCQPKKKELHIPYSSE
jgi:hypothetical protein